MPFSEPTIEADTVRRLASLINVPEDNVFQSFQRLPRNVRLVLVRQLDEVKAVAGNQLEQRPSLEFKSEAELLKSLGQCSVDGLDTALFHLARVYDEAWLKVFQNHTRANQGKSHDATLLGRVVVELKHLAQELAEDPAKINYEINLAQHTVEEASDQCVLFASWQSLVHMDFSIVPTISSLSSYLPGEDHSRPSGRYLAGIGTGGGSDVVSASLLGHLFREVGKDMDLLVSTRTSRTGSQGKPGSTQVGSKRVIYNHGGHAMTKDNVAVPDTYRVQEQTQSEGRDLETIPLSRHQEVWIVLDSEEDIGHRQDSHAEDALGTNVVHHSKLHDQLYTIISAYSRGGIAGKPSINTIVAVDTGGDVVDLLASLGAPSQASDPTTTITPRFSTPDQDTRTVLALSEIPRPDLNLTLAILCPGIDSPSNLPEIARLLGGVRYVPDSKERKLLINLLTDEYHMDGRDDSRFGKSSLCLLEALRRMERLADEKNQVAEQGVNVKATPSMSEMTGEWVNLGLPRHVIMTRQNPWGSFVWISDGMAEIILLPVRELGDKIREGQNPAPGKVKDSGTSP